MENGLLPGKIPLHRVGELLIRNESRCSRLRREITAESRAEESSRSEETGSGGQAICIERGCEPGRKIRRQGGVSIHVIIHPEACAENGVPFGSRGKGEAHLRSKTGPLNSRHAEVQDSWNISNRIVGLEPERGG